MGRDMETPGAQGDLPTTVSADAGGASAFDRRRFLQAAAASTAAVWVAPALTTVTAAPAHAQASPVPGEEPEVEGVQIEDPDDPQVAGVALDRGLPRTGNDTVRLLAAGAAAVAGGAAVVRATQSGEDDGADDALPAG